MGPFYRRGARRSLAAFALVLGVLAGCGSGESTPTSSAPPTTGQPVSMKLLSWCITHTPRGDVRADLVALGLTARQVEVDLGVFDDLVRTGDC